MHPQNEKECFFSLLHLDSGCSSVRLEYASGGRGVASSNLVIPTSKQREGYAYKHIPLFLFSRPRLLPPPLRFSYTPAPVFPFLRFSFRFLPAAFSPSSAPVPVFFLLPFLPPPLQFPFTSAPIFFLLRSGSRFLPAIFFKTRCDLMASRCDVMASRCDVMTSRCDVNNKFKRLSVFLWAVVVMSAFALG